MVITLEARGDGFAAFFPYDPRTVAAIKQVPGFNWNKSERAWVSDGPEVLLELERYRLPFQASGETAERIAKFNQRMDSIIRLKQVNKATVDQGTEDLYAFQAIGAQSLFLQKRGLLADEMGLGKTKQSLDAANLAQAKDILVIAPKTLLYNWEKEVHRWYPKWVTVVISGKATERADQYRFLSGERKTAIPRVVIVNYEKLIAADFPFQLRWDVLIFDEAHYVKNTTAQRHKAVKKIADRSAYVFGLTGTPLETKPEETYGIMKVVRPSVFGNWMRFKEQHLIVDSWTGKISGLKPETKDLFRERLGAWMTRRTKAMVAGQLPPKVYNMVGVELTDDERRIYRDIKKGFDRWVEEQGRMIGSASALTQLIRFQQFTSSPFLLGVEHIGYGSKFWALKELLDGWEEGRAIVFTRFKEMAYLLQRWLEVPDEAIITGDLVDSRERLRRADEFSAGRLGKVFIGTDAMAFGLSISADLVVHYDKLWNPAKEWQREDRAHGIGRGIEGRTTNVVHLLASDTIDVGMHVVTNERADLFRDVVDGAEATVLSSFGLREYQSLVEGRR